MSSYRNYWEVIIMTKNGLKFFIERMEKVYGTEIPDPPEIDSDEKLWINPDSDLPNSQSAWRYIGYHGWNTFRVERFDGTNWYLSNYGGIHWIHITNWLDWSRNTWYLADPDPWQPTADYRQGLPSIMFDYSSSSAKIHFEKRDQQILSDFKYQKDTDSEVYQFALYIHSGFHFWGGKTDNFVDWIPDNLAVLIAHALLIMGDEERANALERIRAFIRHSDPKKYSIPYISDWKLECAKFNYDDAKRHWEELEEQEKRYEDYDDEELDADEDTYEDESEGYRW
jgi:hypothetical protein